MSRAFLGKDRNLMKSFRKTWLTTLALAALIAAAPVWAAEPDNYMPANADLVLMVNFRQIVDSPVVQKYAVEEIKKNLEKDEKAQAFIKATGLNPLKDIDSLMVVNTGGLDKGQQLFVVRGTFDKAKIHTALQDYAKKEAGKLTILPPQDGIQVYEFKPEKKDDKSVFSAFADNKTIVATQSKENTVKAAKGGGKAPAAPTAKMKAALSKVSGKESVWVAGVITDEARAALKKNQQSAAFTEKLDMITGSINITDAAQASLQLHTTDAEAAKQLKGVISQVLSFAKVAIQDNADVPPAAVELLGSLTINVDKTTVDIGLKVTPEMIEKLNKEKK
jgi:hypothetical protein